MLCLVEALTSCLATVQTQYVVQQHLSDPLILYFSMPFIQCQTVALKICVLLAGRRSLITFILKEVMELLLLSSKDFFFYFAKKQTPLMLMLYSLSIITLLHEHAAILELKCSRTSIFMWPESFMLG